MLNFEVVLALEFVFELARGSNGFASQSAGGGGFSFNHIDTIDFLCLNF